MPRKESIHIDFYKSRSRCLYGLGGGKLKYPNRSLHRGLPRIYAYSIVCVFGTPARMISWQKPIDIYLHREPVDFRKAINGLSLIVSESMGLSPFNRTLFVFCNKRRTQLKVLYWDDTGFALWQKRLEKETFKWPRKDLLQTPKITHEQWIWLLRGFDYTQIKPHQRLEFNTLS